MTIEAAFSFYQHGRFDEAETACRTVLAGNAQDFNALHLLASARLQKRDYVQARDLYEKAVALQPAWAEALSALSFVLFQLNCFDEALTAADRAIAAAPSHVPSWVMRANALQRLNRREEALAAYDEALKISPQDIEALVARGTLLVSLDRRDEAVETFERIPVRENILNLFRRAHLQLGLGLFDAAVRDFRKWIKLSSDPLSGWVGLAECAMERCDWQGLIEPRRQVLAAMDKGRSVPGLTALRLSFDSAQQWRNARGLAAKSTPMPPLSRPKQRPPRLRIGYMSPDYRIHPLAFLIRELLERHDRSRFEIIGLSTGPDDNSEIRSRIVAAFDQFHDVHIESDDAICALIRSLGIDVLVDLAGYTQHMRPLVLARRPAPVQAMYLGYCGTSGSDYIDYLVADKIAVPPAEQEFYSEKLVYLPGSFMVTDTTQSIVAEPQTRAQYGLPDDAFVFCCFNKTHKLTQPMFDVWLRLLKAVPGSVLWLSGNLGRGENNLHRYAADKSVGADRLIFAPGVSRDAHFARHRLADLFLDTLPYNAHTTANDALFAGLPVLTVRGPTFVGRVAASMLHAVGLEELVAADLAEYEATALALARDPARVWALKERLAANAKTHSLFQTDRFRANLEKAYDEMFDIYIRGEQPRPFAVTES
jgi:protein O-GlcNAc transferase